MKNIYIIIFIVAMFLKATTVWAGFTGPSTIIQGSWGAGDANFGFESGDTLDSFPGLLVVDETGNIIIGDGVNLRVKIYDATGVWKTNFTYNGITVELGGWPTDLRAKANVGIFSIYEKLQKYDYNGNLVWSVAMNGFQNFWVTDGGVWVQAYGQSKYSLYSPTGQLIKTSTTRPLELGVAESGLKGSSGYLQRVKYPDRVFSFFIPWKTMNSYQQDTRGNLIVTAQTDSKDVVYKISACGKILGQLQMPADKGHIVQQLGSETFSELDYEYGKPVIAPNGDVYTWKRTPDTYSILTWTWVDDPNVLSGPDAPAGPTLMPSTTGLYLTWTASTSDPGCVTGYEVSRATTAGGVASIIATVDKGVIKYNDTTTVAGTTYYYKVRAVAGHEFSPYTSEVSGKR